jgi:uncharacterized protein YjbI with pentapeptide repeats
MPDVALLEHVIPVDDRDPERRYGLRAVRSDLTSRMRFQYPAKGEARSDHSVDPHNRTACPHRPGDGLCVGLTWWGMALGNIPATTLLAVSWNPADTLAEDDDKARVRALRVERVVDGARLVREHGAGADLRGAYLGNADLRYVNLRYANLRSANLRDANLWRAYLQNADLRHANLRDANLRDANLRNAYLQNADLRYADLRYADLQGAYLGNANLRDANLQGSLQD